MKLDYEFLTELLRELPSEEDQIELDAEKTRQKFEKLIREDALLYNAWGMYMNYPMSEEHLYQKIIIELIKKSNNIEKIYNELMERNPFPSYITNT